MAYHGLLVVDFVVDFVVEVVDLVVDVVDFVVELVDFVVDVVLDVVVVVILLNDAFSVVFATIVIEYGFAVLPLVQEANV